MIKSMELAGFAESILDSNARKFQGVGIDPYCVYVNELINTGYDSSLTARNIQTVDVGFFTQKLQGFFRSQSGEIIASTVGTSLMKH